MLRLMGITREGVTGSQCRFALDEGEQRKKGKDVKERERMGDASESLQYSRKEISARLLVSLSQTHSLQ